MPQLPLPQHNRKLPHHRGRGLGGSSAINGMVYFRGHPLDFDDWAAAGASGWSFREVLPYFKRSENNMMTSESVGIKLQCIFSLVSVTLLISVSDLNTL